jgi:hypothetical protein
MTHRKKSIQMCYMCAPWGGPSGYRLRSNRSLQTLRRFQADPGDYVPLTIEASPREQHGEL